ncbi:MAG TPA: ABC transporter permease [Candidatus Acidoferrales bacterium]|nr:ABC transporter permease [Candidatus Acidoferrales bacterium]
MRSLRRFFTRLANFVTRRRDDERLKEEIEEHIALQTAENLRAGLSPAEARRQAMLKFGAVEAIKEDYRAERGMLFIETLLQDIRFGLRMLRKSPGFTAVAVLTLALGIGANTAIFSLVDGILLRPLPYPHSDRIVYFGWMDKQRLIPDLNVPELEFCRDRAASFAAIAGFQGYGDQELNQDASKSWVTTAFVTDGFFETLGVNLQLGRPFGREFTRAGGAFAAVLSDSLWRSVFGADPNIVGRQIVLNNQSYTVTGVLPPDFKYTQPADLFVSAHLGHSLGDEGLNTDVIGRLKPGVSLAQGRAEARLLGTEFFAQASPEQHQGAGFLHLDLLQEYLASDYRTTLLMLFSAVGLLLLIACANVASLLLARAVSRQKEISIRLALGAGRRRLLQQFLAEGLLLGIFGAASGLAAAVASLRVFVSAIPWDLPSIDRIGLDSRVLLFTSLVAIAASIVFGLASFLQTRKLDLNSTLKDGRAVAGASRGRVSVLNSLVVGEVAISLVLAFGAGLLIESLYQLHQVKLGFNPAHLVVMHTPFTPPLASSTANVWDFERQALARIRAIPGVQSAAIVSVAPLHGQGNLPVQRENHPEDSIGGTEYRSISSNYFSTMGVPVLRGRVFDQSDFASSAPAAVINETLARDWWAGENPIGNRIVLGEYQGRQYLQIPQPALQVIGVVADVKGMLLTAPTPAMVYVPASQGFSLNGSTDWVIRASAPAGIATALRKAITDVAPDQRVTDLQPMTALIGASVSQPNFEALLMGTFGGLALLLMLVGVYGVLSFQVAQRTHEIGVRIALGATRREIWRLVVGRASKVAVVGVLIGLFCAFGLTHLMASLLYEVRPTDPLIFASVAVAVLFVALLACYLPARRAMKVDPMVALRYE